MALLLILGVVAVPAVQAAIERSVVERMGDVHVIVRDVTGTLTAQASGPRTPQAPGPRPQAPDANLAKQQTEAWALGPESFRLVAMAEPGARFGQPIRFVLTIDGKRAGTAIATVDVTAPVVRATRSIGRNDEIGAADVETAMVPLKDVAFRRLPITTDIVGTRARRDITAGELMTNALVLVPPAIRSGDLVRVVLTMGTVQVTGEGRASGSGQIGDRIRVLTPSSRKPLTARITGRGAVEIVQ